MDHGSNLSKYKHEREREREREREVSLLRAMWNWAEREDRVGERELGLEGSITLLSGKV